MATEIINEDTKIQKIFDELEAQKTILTSCTHLFKSLSDHFSSLQQSISLKSQTLDSQFQTLDSHSTKTLDSLQQRQDSIPERESAAAVRVAEQKDAALADFDKPIASALSVAMKSYCRRMDSQGLLKFMVSKRKESNSLKSEIIAAMGESVDFPTLVLDGLAGFLESKPGKVVSGLHDKRWACAILIQVLFQAAVEEEEKAVFARSVVERAVGILEGWRGKVEGSESGVVMGPAEAVMFLQMVVGFGLKDRFDQELLRKLVIDFPSRRDMAKLASLLGFGEKMGDIIDELAKSGKEIEAAYFASESGLTERYPPINFIKSFLRNSKKKAISIAKNGNYSTAANDESGTVELTSIKSIIKCVEDHKLESELPLSSLRQRATQLERTKTDRRKSSASASRTSHKRSRGGGGGGGRGPPSVRPPKAPRYSNPHPSFGPRDHAPPHQSPVPRYSLPYNYPSQSVYDAPITTPYAPSQSVYDAPITTPYAPSSYGGSLVQPAAPIHPQHYSLSGEDVGVSGLRATGSYGGQTSYAAYDYTNAAPPTYPP